VAKADRLLGKLASTRENLSQADKSHGISAHTEDLLHPTLSAGGAPGTAEPYDVVTMVGILEYFGGFTRSTTEEHNGQPASDHAVGAVDLLRKVAGITAESGSLIANTYRVEFGARILEIYGKRLRFRHQQELRALAAAAGFLPSRTAGSGNIFDVEVFEKCNGESTGEE